MGNMDVGMSFRDARGLFERALMSYNVKALAGASGRDIDESVDLGELPPAVKREWGGCKAVFRLPYIDGPVMAALRAGTLPEFADLPTETPSHDHLLKVNAAWAGAARDFAVEVAATAPRRPGAEWYVADGSAPFTERAAELLEVARERYTEWARVFIAWNMAEGVL